MHAFDMPTPVQIGLRVLLNQQERVSKRSGRDAGNGDQRNIGITAAVGVDPHDGIAGRVTGGDSQPAIGTRGCASIAERIEQRPEVYAVRIAGPGVKSIDGVPSIGQRGVDE